MLVAYIYRSITHRVHSLDKTSRDLFICAKDLFIAAMVDGSALSADGLIADEADRFDATKAGITVCQEQRPSDVPATRSQWSRGFSAPRQAPGRYATTCEPDIGRRSEVQSVNLPSTMYVHPRVRLVFHGHRSNEERPRATGW